MKRFYWIPFILMFFMVVLPAHGAINISKTMEQAQKGVAEAQLRLGKAYYLGTGVPQDYHEAFLWYEKAANQGEAKAQRPLGALYEAGRGVGKDYSKAAFWYGKAAQQGLARAQVNLGILHENGQGVEKDYQKAFFWYQKAANQGYGRGANHLGMLYEKGLGVKRDIPQALQLYKQGAKVKYSKAMMNLGRIFEQGTEGIEKDPKEASVWYQRAVNIGYKNALPELRRVQSLLAKEAGKEPQVKKTEAQPQIEEEKDVRKAFPPAEESEAKISSPILQEEVPRQKIVSKPKELLPKDLELEVTQAREGLDEAEEKLVEGSKKTEIEALKISTEELKDELLKEPEERSRAYFIPMIILGNLLLVLLFWLFMVKRRARPRKNLPAVIGDIGRDIQVIRKQVEELKDHIG